MPRPALALAFLLSAGLLPLAAVSLGWDWYLDGPLVVLLAVGGGYAAGAWLPHVWAVIGVVVAASALATANQLHVDTYHWLDDLVFFLAVVGGPAAAGAAVTTRAHQVERLTRLQTELEELRRMEIAAARLDEQNRVVSDVHSRLAEQIAGIAIRAEGARRGDDATALGAIEAEARSVLDQLRATLGSMRGEGPEAAAVTSDSCATASPDADPTAPDDPTRRLSLLDVLVPAVVGIALAVETAVIDDARGPWWANALAALAVAAPLAARRHHPVVATAAWSAAGVGMSAVLTPIPETVTGVALLLLVFYSVGAWWPQWWWLAGWVVAALGAVGMEWVSSSGADPAGGDDQWIVLLWTVGAVALGRITAGWQQRLRRTTDVVEALDRGRGAAVRLAVAEQREALAGELHDTVAHAMTVVCLQAGAHQRVGNDPDGALRVIGSVAEKSLVELRDGIEAMETAGNPLDRARLAALGRRVGVDLEVVADDTGTGPAAVLAHRVIREAVVNVARHAPGARAAVQVRRAGDALSVEVVDDGSPESAVLEGTGTGLRGLADALETIGGRLEWGHLEPGGFRVAALIPQGPR